MSIDLRALIGKLNRETRNAFEGAAGLCLSRTHYDVEIEHYLLKLLDTTDTDLAILVRQFKLDPAKLSKELADSIEGFRTGNARTPALSPYITRMLSEAWLLASLDFGDTLIRTGHTVLALLVNEDLKRLVQDSCAELTKIDADELRSNFFSILADSGEGAGPMVSESVATERIPPKASKLSQYSHHLTQWARDGKLDPVVGRDFEVRQVVDILTRRRQNNPILVGEAGVGKTAVVEGFAVRVAAGDVPDPLKNAEIHTLDLALLQAGAGVKGEFENRLKGLIQEVKASPHPIILFIDEAHTLIGAGGAAGQSDAANLLKPALARGELRTIAATTWSEYKQHIETDPALTRRFQLVKVEEPSEETCEVMIRSLAGSLERHHRVRILDEGIRAAVRLSHRYLSDRHLPDKAVSVLDTACARLALGQSSTPAAIEGLERQLEDIALQTRILSREAATGSDHSKELGELEARSDTIRAQVEELRQRWGEERHLVFEAMGLRSQLEALAGAEGPGDPVWDAVDGDTEETATVGQIREKEEGSSPESPEDSEGALEGLKAELEGITKKLDAIQGETPLVPLHVDDELVGQVIEGWTGIPVGKQLRDDVQTVLGLEEHFRERIVGQDHALRMISRRIRTSRAGIEDPRKPVGVFLLVGPSGVGKTETALALSDLLYGGEQNLITVNMSEFQEEYSVSTLKGAPPGYVGYGKGGVLTEAVRRRPYSVVLLDEVEKAHPDVLELFYQVFDKGRMEDGEGRQIDFKNTVIMLTTNACSEPIMALTSDPETAPAPEVLSDALKPELMKIFKPAFIGRLEAIPYLPLSKDTLEMIVELKIQKIRSRMVEAHGIHFSFADDVVGYVAGQCGEAEIGAREIDNILTDTLLPEVSQHLLEKMAAGGHPETLHVTLNESGGFLYQLG